MAGEEKAKCHSKVGSNNAGLLQNLLLYIIIILLLYYIDIDIIIRISRVERGTNRKKVDGPFPN